MKLLDLDPKWLMRDGKRVGFVFRNPVRKDRGWWTSCLFDPTPGDEQERLIESVLGPDALCQECNPAYGWKVINGSPDAADFASISITPSLDGGAGFWHGFITNGNIT